ncbi:Art10p [Maudiozyma exigua]|uniref:Art10p n=1 Tax=Maudiozyma exigua TaxID=34358 RepID=A0A9P6WET5_MAUEX|nr:Art10p [Kazachstania exigua]
MAPSKRIELTLSKPINGVFYTGEDNISGDVKITFSKSVSVKKISVHLKAFSETITKVDSDYAVMQNGLYIQGPDTRTFHNMLNLEQRVFPPDNVWNALEGSSKPFKVNPGEYNYTFKFDKLAGVKPNCLKYHGKETIMFTKKQHTKLPPSFNNLTNEMNKIDNLDLYFYSLGKILYIVQVAVELGKAKSWFKPFDKVMREQQLIEYIPNKNDLDYDQHENVYNSRVVYNNSSSPGVRTSSLGQQLRERSKQSTLSIDPRITSLNISADASNSVTPIESPKMNLNMNGNISTTASSPEPSNGQQMITVNQSTFKIRLPHSGDNRHVMWIEVRTKNNGFNHLYRRDALFRKGSNKFDKVYVVFRSNNIEELKRIKIKPAKIQLNLLETTTFLSEGIANENLSSLRLINVDSNDNMDNLIDMNELSPYPSHMNPDSEGYYKMECPLNLRDHPSLKRLLFNEENYRHRGNMLYSFKSCAISRIFDLQLMINWDIYGEISLTEVIIDDVQLYCWPRRIYSRRTANMEPEYLPRYVEPPTYGDIVDRIVVNSGDIKQLS